MPMIIENKWSVDVCSVTQVKFSIFSGDEIELSIVYGWKSIVVLIRSRNWKQQHNSFRARRYRNDGG